MASQGTLLWVQAGAPAAPRCLSHSPFPPVFFLHSFRNLSWLLRCPGYSECTLMLERTLLLGDLTPCHQHVQTLDSSGLPWWHLWSILLSSTQSLLSATCLVDLHGCGQQNPPCFLKALENIEQTISSYICRLTELLEDGCCIRKNFTISLFLFVCVWRYVYCSVHVGQLLGVGFCLPP